MIYKPVENTEIFSIMSSGAPGNLEVKERGISDGIVRSFYARIELRGNEKGTTPNFRSDWFRFKRSPPASTPDSKAADGAGDCT